MSRRVRYIDVAHPADQISLYHPFAPGAVPMSPIIFAILSAALSAALSEIKPEMVLWTAAKLVAIIDQFMSNRRIWQRVAWNSIRGSLLNATPAQAAAIIQEAKRIVAAAKTANA